MQRILAAALFALFAFVTPVQAQSNSVVLLPNGCGTGNATNSMSYLTVDSTLKLCVNATVSASIAGFPTTQTTGTPISVTTGGVSGNLPGGAVVVASNVGATNGAYCKLGASATTSDQLIPPNSWFAFTVGAATQLTCITSTSTTTVNMVGGSGLPTGSGGGGGGSGSSGAVFGPTAVGSANANPPVLIGGTVTGAAGQNVEGVAVKPASTASVATDLSLVTNESPNSQLSAAIGANGAAHTCASQSVNGCLGQIDDDIKGPIAAGSALIGKVGIDQTTPGTTNGVQLPTTSNGGAATVKGGVGVVNGGSTYQAVAASATATVLQTSTGAAGDYLSHCVIYPTSTSPGAVTVFDNTNTAATSAILFAGGSSSASNLTPIAVPVGAVSTAGAWKVTTGSAVSVVCFGKFS